MAFKQVSRSSDRWRGAAAPASQWLQDFQSYVARAHHARGTGPVAARLRLDAILRRRSRTGADARGHGGDDGHRRGPDQKNPERCPHSRQPYTSALADDRPQFTQRLDRAEGGGWLRSEENT